MSHLAKLLTGEFGKKTKTGTAGNNSLGISEHPLSPANLGIKGVEEAFLIFRHQQCDST
jgi:hypothetical protein